MGVLKNTQKSNKTKKNGNLTIPVFGLSDWTWTSGLYHPKVARYQLRHTQIALIKLVYYTTGRANSQDFFWILSTNNMGIKIRYFVHIYHKGYSAHKNPPKSISASSGDT